MRDDSDIVKPNNRSSCQPWHMLAIRSTPNSFGPSVDYHFNCLPAQCTHRRCFNNDTDKAIFAAPVSPASVCGPYHCPPASLHWSSGRCGEANGEWVALAIPQLVSCSLLRWVLPPLSVYLKEVAFEVSCALPSRHTSFFLFVLRVIMSRSLDECDAILADMCDCYRMSVERTRWYGDNIGCHFRECAEDVVVYERRWEEEKKNFKETLAGLSIPCDVVKNLVLEATDPVEPVEPAPARHPPMEEWE
ncbi:hypothetical protein DCAR_0206002 [Daucus carota subsp. sativus]|uniref:Uncharacterized protein n=1 Tax=Daucus carota subsp. sativus TaxID=79200 RepID=A0A166CYX6_DAUCS|nr:hypothetical protein DCAR_0206002 [Daucus carota subsp. sativus]